MNINSDQAKGKIKEAAGILTDNEKLETEGKEDQLAGDAKDVVEKVADTAENVIDEVKKAARQD